MLITLVKPVYFNFESDFVDTLRCIPMIVRYKLDTCDKKLQLPEWSRLNKDEKNLLAEMACESPGEIKQYRTELEAMVWNRSKKAIKDLGGVEATWDDLGQVPDEVQQKAREWECAPLTLRQWQSLSLMQRFALVKLSRSGHEGENFPRALAEFGIA